ncbi:MAG: hypothetical protein V3S24_16300, partial [Candidatus Tectomicrobia bacterium]
MISGDPELVHSEFWSHGPMIMVGKVDPSTNFSHSTARQLMLTVPAEVRDGAMVRMPFTPYAFGAKFFGLFKGGEDELILPTTPFCTIPRATLAWTCMAGFLPILYCINSVSCRGAMSA